MRRVRVLSGLRAASDKCHCFGSCSSHRFRKDRHCWGFVFLQQPFSEVDQLTTFGAKWPKRADSPHTTVFPQVGQFTVIVSDISLLSNRPVRNPDVPVPVRFSVQRHKTNGKTALMSGNLRISCESSDRFRRSKSASPPLSYKNHSGWFVYGRGPTGELNPHHGKCLGERVQAGNPGFYLASRCAWGRCSQMCNVGKSKLHSRLGCSVADAPEQSNDLHAKLPDTRRGN